MHYARIADGIVVEILDLPESFSELVVDDDGHPILKGGTLVVAEPVLALGEDGFPVLDDDGKPVMEGGVPVLGDDGKPVMKGGDFQYRDRPMTPADAFAPELAEAMVACEADVAQGWRTDGKTFSPPVPPEFDLDAAKGAASAAVNARRDAIIGGGYRHNFGSTAGIRTLDQRDAKDETAWLTIKINAMEAVAAGAGALPIPIRDAGNETFEVSAAVASAAMTAMAQWRSAVSQRSWDLKDEIEAAADQAALEAIDIEADWPGA